MLGQPLNQPPTGSPRYTIGVSGYIKCPVDLGWRLSSLKADKQLAEDMARQAKHHDIMYYNRKVR